MRMFLIAVVAVVAFATPGPQKLAAGHGLMSFEEFVTTFGKKYHGAEHSAKRATFEANLKKIEEHNNNYRAGKVTHYLGVNQFADMTPDEWKASISNPIPHKHLKGKTYHGQNPDSVDWTTGSTVAVTPVKNQGQCGSCWAFSTVGSVEGAFVIDGAGDLTQFSEQELVDCAGSYGNNGCQGGLMDNGFRFVEAHGLTFENTYRYTARNGRCDTSLEGQVGVKISGYQDVSSNNQTALEAAVANRPVSVAIEADKSAFQLYSGGILTNVRGCGTQLDHGVLLVGYGEENGTKYWKVKNSWGARWGENGFIRMIRGDGSPKGCCGIQSQPSYATGATKGSGPSPGPTPGPGPSGNDWTNPFTGPCGTGDLNITIQGVPGAMCTPPCDSNNNCPDAPSGFTGAQAQCALSGSSGKYCALICSPTDSTACNPSGDATCKSIQGVGICTYNDGSGPGPSPGPTTGPYEDPVSNGGNCASGEQNVHLQGVSGGYCAPSCSIFTPCPDASGINGQPQCAVKVQGSYKKLCAVICNPSDSSACAPPAMQCQAVSGQAGVGVCTYADDAVANFELIASEITKVSS